MKKFFCLLSALIFHASNIAMQPPEDVVQGAVILTNFKKHSYGKPTGIQECGCKYYSAWGCICTELRTWRLNLHDPKTPSLTSQLAKKSNNPTPNSPAPCSKMNCFDHLKCCLQRVKELNAKNS